MEVFLVKIDSSAHLPEIKVEPSTFHLMFHVSFVNYPEQYAMVFLCPNAKSKRTHQ